MIGRLKELTLNRDGSQNVTVTVNSDFREEFDRLKDSDIRMEIKKFSKHRSLEANSYAWLLIDKISERCDLSKTEIYQKTIREIGGVSQAICTKTENVDQIAKWWTAKGLGWQVDIFPSKVNGCTNMTLYCGSSEYDTAQMSRLINLLVQEAEGLGIPTISPKEEQKMLERWGRKKADSKGPEATERGDQSGEEQHPAG